MSSWPDVVLLFATRCLYLGVWVGRGYYLTSVHLTTGLCDQSSHTHGHKMSLPGESQFDILFDRQSASQPTCQLQLASQPAMWQNINLSGLGLVIYLVEGRVRLTFCLIPSQPACQLQLASQPAMWQSINLLGFGLVRYMVAGGLGAWPHWATVQGPSTPTGSPWGVTYLTKARQVTQSELCSLLYTFGTMFRDHLQFCIYAASSHILACTVEKCYMTMLSPDQFTHILPPSIWCITTGRYYFCGTTFITRNQKCYGKSLKKVHLNSGQADLT